MEGFGFYSKTTEYVVRSTTVAIRTTACIVDQIKLSVLWTMFLVLLRTLNGFKIDHQYNI